ncbi:MAG: sugar phosphate isomerase/epimerase [Chloroflexi bacterium]|nr:sugar phosphate isomerase/epimerase [Chloroflexota bacterium]MCL5273738.1 sugar phosphate isomerase/epimerase [Chloroflexota bacterium]
MKYSAHCYIFTDRWSDAQIGLLDTARELGLDGFEIAVGDDVLFKSELTRRRAESLGLELAVSPGGAWPYECDLSAHDPGSRKLGLAWHCRQIDMAAALGATAYTGALYGHPGVLLYHRPSGDELRWTADGLRSLAEYGLRNDVQVVIEPMSHFRTHVANNATQAMSLIQAADHPNLMVLLDTYHLITEVRDYCEQIRATRHKLWGIHACENDRGVPGNGLVPWQSVFRALHDIAFDGHMVFESYNSTIGDPPGDFAFRRGMMHNVCDDGSAFVKTGLAFLKAGMQQATA